MECLYANIFEGNRPVGVFERRTSDKGTSANGACPVRKPNNLKRIAAIESGNRYILHIDRRHIHKRVAAVESKLAQMLDSAGEYLLNASFYSLKRPVCL